jgi:hypothetical protein
VTGLPLFAAGANDTLIRPAATRMAVTRAGAAGAPATTGADRAEAGPDPRALVAVTEHVYVLPVVTDATVIGAAAAPECVPVLAAPPLLEVHLAV